MTFLIGIDDDEHLSAKCIGLTASSDLLLTSMKTNSIFLPIIIEIQALINCRLPVMESHK